MIKKHNVQTVLALALVSAAVFLLPAVAAAQDPADPTAPILERKPDIITDAEVKLLDEEGAGKLYQVGEHLLCVMEGTPREMGFQHGRLLAEKAQHAMKVGYIKQMLWDRGYTPEYVHAQSARMEKHFPEKYVEELKGLVDGMKAAGIEDVTYEDARLGLTSSELLHFDPDAAPGCSNFAVWGRWTTDGRLLHGRNLDWSVGSDAQDDAVVFVWRPEGGAPFMMVGWAGGIGSVSGMNAKGITLGEMTLPSPNATFDGLPLTLRMRQVVEEAGDIEEAVALLRDPKQTSGWNFILGDAQIPDGRALEVDAKYVHVYKPMDPNEGPETAHKALPDAVRRTNHPVRKERLVELAQTFGKEYGIEASTWEELKPLLPLVQSIDTFQRYDYLGRAIEANEGAIDVETAIQMLANGPVYCDVTLHSWVFDPENNAAYVANAGNNPPVTATLRPFTKIDLAPWFE
ncbi:MAG: C45 family autoproteolytic acyltransferase/hydrolase [Candidatus Hydrogenedentota bacterium]